MKTDLLPKEFEELEFSMSQFQIKHFVVGSQHNLFRQFKQILLELEVRMVALETMTLDYRKTLAEKKLAEEKFANETSTAQKELYQIEIERHEKTAENHARATARTENEIKILNEILDEFRQQHDVPALLQNKEQLEEEYWIKRLATQSALEMLTTGRIGQGNLEALTQLGPDKFKKALAETTQITRQVNDQVKHLDMLDETAMIEAGRTKTLD